MSQHEPRAARRQPFQRVTGLAAVVAAAVLVAWSVLPGATGNAVAASTLTLTAVADAEVTSSSATGNYGLLSSLEARAGSPEFRTFLRFTVSGLSEPVTSARLRLFATDSSSNGGAVLDVKGRWTESMITWATAPTPGDPLGTFGKVAAGKWVEIDLLPGTYAADGSYSMVVTNNGNQQCDLLQSRGRQPTAADPDHRRTHTDPGADAHRDPQANAAANRDRRSHGADPDTHDRADVPTRSDPDPDPETDLCGPAPGPGGADPINCTGYKEPRVSLETQDWWTASGDAVEGMSQHIHLATCFPLDQTLKGTVPFDIHVQLHMNPGMLTVVDLQVFGNSVSVSQTAAKPNLTCPTAQCDLWYHLDYDTTKVPADGSLEFRFHAKVTSPDGTLGYTSSGWQAILANGGRPVQSYRPAAYLEARGWYEGTSYENARFVTPLPSGPVKGLVDLRGEPRAGLGRVAGQPRAGQRRSAFP